MSRHQIGLTAIAIVLLSPTLVSAKEAIDATQLNVGKIQMMMNDRGTSINTPNIQIDTSTTTDRQMLLSRHQRILMRRKPIAVPVIVRPSIDFDDNEPIVIIFPSESTPIIPKVPKVPAVPSVQTSTIRTIPTVRSSTIRTIDEDNDSLTVSEQHQSVQCSGSGTVSQSSSSTINGRTVKSQVRSKCY